MFRFIRSFAECSEYLDTRSGENRLFLHGRAMPDLHEIWEIDDLIARFNARLHPFVGVRYFDWDAFAERLVNPGDADDVNMCGRCDTLHPYDAVLWCDDDSGHVCDTCRDNWGYEICSHCENLSRYWSDVNEEGFACNSCLDYTDWCEHCEVRFWTATTDHSECSGDDSTRCCDPRFTSFSIPVMREIASTVPGRLDANEYVPVVPNQERVVSPSGQRRIRDLLTSDLDASYRVGDIGSETYYPLYEACRLIGVFMVGGWAYKTEDGRFTRRVQKYLLDKSGDARYKVPEEVLSKVGQIAEETSRVIDEPLTLSITRDLNDPAEDFGHSESCWWSDYSYSRCTLKSNAGFGLRAWADGGYVLGRMWVIPFKVNVHGALEPSYAAEPDCYVAFNSYGVLDERRGTEAFATLTGMVYVACESGDWNMYVNSGATYLIAPADKIAEYGALLPSHLSRHADLPAPAELTTV